MSTLLFLLATDDLPPGCRARVALVVLVLVLLVTSAALGFDILRQHRSGAGTGDS
ncbi:hypothetical protein [Catenuloplanes atrovinosus]|uniref:Uncharacterized protein n=1 Tax=Catenuloplanes atrovinosus TaxID=137266 RepID=A0AAE3YJM7_9ACTN|nr:hypothetical protein [Catenuloplanes atrovinosus]MDR7273640.1 hypothetical protein [Catenuloplanes atrovinosus]